MRDEEGHMKWCCVGFNNMSGEVGKRGAAVLVDASVASETPRFLVQFRAVDAEAHTRFPDDVPISLVMEIGIKFCPWCGTLLGEFYASGAARISHPELRIR